MLKGLPKPFCSAARYALYNGYPLPTMDRRGGTRGPMRLEAMGKDPSHRLQPRTATLALHFRKARAAARGRAGSQWRVHSFGKRKV